MIISKEMERKEGREKPKGKAKKEEVIRRKGRRRGRRKLGKRRKTEGRRTGGRRRRRSQSKCICRYMGVRTKLLPYTNFYLEVYTP